MPQNPPVPYLSTSQQRAPRIPLGAAGVEVSRLCFGLGSSGCGTDSMQGHLPLETVAAFLEGGAALGVTWWDTSDDYGSHPHVALALRRLGRERVQITSKTHAGTASAVRSSVERSLQELGVEHIDIMLLHEVDSLEAWEARQEGLAELHRLRSEGKLRSVGLSTHAIDVLEVVAGNPLIEVLLTNFNFAEVHMDASLEAYELALRRAFTSGQGVAVMKTLGEGVLASQLQRSLHYSLSREFVHGVLVGVVSESQVCEAVAAWQAFREG